MQDLPDQELSNFVYVSGNGEIKHEHFMDGTIGGVFQWEELNLDFYIEYNLDEF
jgi:hypothetical protein